MRAFMDESFLLNSETAVALYGFCKDLPIIDYHCHLIPQEIAENKRFENITDLALRGDHYKWRLMRANGVEERFITGNASDEEKFEQWCYTIEDCIGNPVYHWAHLEMQRYFGYDKPIAGENAKDIFEHCNRIIARDDFSVWNIFRNYKVAQVGTTDDPADTLEWHKKIAASGEVGLPKVQPTFRPSTLLDVGSPNFKAYLEKMGKQSGHNITDWSSLLVSVAARIAFFKEMGCVSSDHAFDYPVFEEKGDEREIFARALKGESLSEQEVNRYKTAMMLWLGEQYAAKGWIMQLHIGAQRNNNSRMFGILGADTGYDSMSDLPFSLQLARFLDELDKKNMLPKTVLYALNPAFDDMLSVMIGNFQGGDVPGKMQWGSAWWFNDSKLGMERHLVTLANGGMLARFIGMLTDSRSFMSYPRHEYFRRILAQVVARWVDNGEFPNDMGKLKKLMEGIAYYNAKEYFGV